MGKMITYYGYNNGYNDTMYNAHRNVGSIVDGKAKYG